MRWKRETWREKPALRVSVSGVLFGRRVDQRGCVCMCGGKRKGLERGWKRGEDGIGTGHTIRIKRLQIRHPQHLLLVRRRSEQLLAKHMHLQHFPQNAVRDLRSLGVQQFFPRRAVVRRGDGGVDVFHQLGVLGREVHEVQIMGRRRRR